MLFPPPHLTSLHLFCCKLLLLPPFFPNVAFACWQQQPASTTESLLRLHRERVRVRMTECIVCGVKSATRTCTPCANAQKLHKLSRYRYMQDGTNHPRLWNRYILQLEELCPADS